MSVCLSLDLKWFFLPTRYFLLLWLSRWDYKNPLLIKKRHLDELHSWKKSRHWNMKCIMIADSMDSSKPSTVLSSWFKDLHVGILTLKRTLVQIKKNVTARIMAFVIAEIYASVNGDNDKGKAMIRLSI